MTVRQTERMVADLAQADTAADWSLRLAHWSEGTGAMAVRERARPRRVQSEAEAISVDVATLRRVGARLEARLLARPLSTLGPGPAQIVRRSLEDLLGVLRVLTRAVAAASKGQSQTVRREEMA